MKGKTLPANNWEGGPSFQPYKEEAGTDSGTLIHLDFSVQGGTEDVPKVAPRQELRAYDE